MFEHKDPPTNPLDCCWLKRQRYYRSSNTRSSEKKKKKYSRRRLVSQLNMASRHVGCRRIHIFRKFTQNAAHIITAVGRVVMSYCCWVSCDVLLHLLLQWSSYVAARRRQNIARAGYRSSRVTEKIFLVPIALSRWGAD